MTQIRQFMSEQSLLGGEEPIRAMEQSFAMMNRPGFAGGHLV